jgi:hypothetical protein
MQGVHGCYCVCPNASYKEKWLRKWSGIVTFSQKLWEEIQNFLVELGIDWENYSGKLE